MDSHSLPGEAPPVTPRAILPEPVPTQHSGGESVSHDEELYTVNAEHQRRIDEAKKALGASEHRFQAVLDHSTAIIFVKDLEGQLNGTGLISLQESESIQNRNAK